MKWPGATFWTGGVSFLGGTLLLAGGLLPAWGPFRGVMPLMAPNLALGIALAGGALLLHRRSGKFARTSTRAFAVLLMLEGGARLAADVLALPEGFHAFLVLHASTAGEPQVYAASFGAAALLFTGAAFGFLGWHERVRAADVFAASLAVAAGVVGLGFVGQFAVGSQSAHTSPMAAALKSLFFTLIASGLVAAALGPAPAGGTRPASDRRETQPAEKKLAVALGATLGLFTLTALLACTLFNRFVEDHAHAMEVERTLALLQRLPLAPAATPAEPGPDRARLVNALRAESDRRFAQHEAARVRTQAALVVAGLAIAALLLGLHVVFERDLSARRRSDAALRRHNETLHSFAHTVAHDLRAPLRGIVGYARELNQLPPAALGDRSRHCLRQIDTAAQNLEHLITDTLDYARLDAEEPQLTTVALPALIAALLEQRAPQIREYRTEISTNFGIAAVTSWERGLAQIVGNLLDNALKYSRQAQPPRIRIETADGPLAWRLAIHDNGIGFDMKYHDRIFGLFQRLVAADEFEGTGAGLAIARKITDRLGGTVRAEARPHGGATFLVELPKIADDELA